MKIERTDITDAAIQLASDTSTRPATPGVSSPADAVLDDGLRRRVAWDRKTRLATVYDEHNNLLCHTERGDNGIRQLVLANGVRPPVAIQDKLFSHVWIDDTKHKAVMMLEGRKRV